VTDVFVSYARGQRPFVDRLVEALRELELVVWFDRELTPGKEFPAEIELHASTCKAMIVCWSKEAATSTWVQREAGIGRSRGVLIPTFLEKCEPPYPFDTIQTIDLQKLEISRNDSRFDDLLDQVARLTGKVGLIAAWAAIVHGRNNELVTRVRRELVRLARARGTTSYPLMAALMSVDQPTLWAALDAAAEENRLRREPPLCALVISDRTERPGKGYFQKHAFLRDDFDELAVPVWESHRDRVWAHAWTDG
jgi:TIR domain